MSLLMALFSASHRDNTVPLLRDVWLMVRSSVRQKRQSLVVPRTAE